MFEVLYHSPKILGVSSLENKFARLWISTQKQFPPVPRSLFLFFQPKNLSFASEKIIFLRLSPSPKPEILLLFQQNNLPVSISKKKSMSLISGRILLFLLISPPLKKEKSPACCAWIFVNMAAGFFPCRPAAWISPWWTDSACAPSVMESGNPLFKRICGCSLEN